MNFTPLEHVVCVIRERLGDTLLAEGYSESSRLYADQLAYAFWRRDTLDSILQDLQFILDEDDYAGILGFCKLQYPVLYATIPSSLKPKRAALPGTQHTSSRGQGVLDSAAIRASSFETIWPAAARSMGTQQQPFNSME